MVEQVTGAGFGRASRRRWLRAIGFALIAFVMPLACVTCRPAAPESGRALFPTWKLGEWWEVESTFAAERPSQGADLAGLDLHHRFEVVGEDKVDGEACWRVEVRPASLPKPARAEAAGLVSARFWVAKDTFRPVKMERKVGAGRHFSSAPLRESSDVPAAGGALLLEEAFPTILDLPFGPRRSDEPAGASWKGQESEAARGRRIRQTALEIVEKRGLWRERVLRVTLSDGQVACNQVWRPDRPWPDSFRTWAGVSPKAPFVYQTTLKAWSAEPYRSHMGTFFLIFGFVAQAMFTFRFVVQWIMSERAKRSVIPMAFWYFSLLGGTMLLIYSIYRVDPVFIMGQGAGVIIYIRNVVLRLRERRQAAAGGAQGESAGGH